MVIAEHKRYREHFYKNRWHLNSGPDVFPSGFTESDSSLFHCCPEWLNLYKRNEESRWWLGWVGHTNQFSAACTYSVRAVRPGNLPVHHPRDAGLLASMCQHFAHSLTRCHAACGPKLLLHRPLLGWTDEHRDRRAGGEHLCCHVVLAARKLQPVTTKRDKKNNSETEKKHGTGEEIPGKDVFWIQFYLNILPW